jgi:hypothetical protein
MRVFARRERPHPGAQPTLFEAGDGWWYSLWTTNPPATTKGWRGHCAYIDAAHRIHARVEEVIRTGKDTGVEHLPSAGYGEQGVAGRRDDRSHPENRRVMAVGRGDHHRLAAHPGRSRKLLDQQQPVSATRKGETGADGTPGTRPRQPTTVIPRH